MFEGIRKHQGWLWTLIGFAVIISFVVFFLPNVNMMGQGGDRAELGQIDGDPITVKEFQAAQRQARLAMLMQFGPQIPDTTLNQFVREQQVYNRIFFDAQMKKFGINPGPKAMAQVAKEKLQMLSRAGIQSYDDLVKTFLPQRGYSLAEFNAYLRHEASMEQLSALLGIPGALLTPQEAESAFRKENELITGQIAVFAATNYLSQVKFAPEDVQKFYTNQMANYRSEEKRVIQYSVFPSSNFFAHADDLMAKRTDLTNILDNAYKEQGPETFKDEAGKPLAADAAKAKIKEQFRKELAMSEARKKAYELAAELIEMERKTSADLEIKAKGREIAVLTTPAFSKDAPPPVFEKAPEVVERAFALDQAEPFEGPLQGEDAWYVIGLKEIIESAVQPFETVKEKVTEDYKKAEAEGLARKAGTALAQAIQGGKSFTDAAREAGVPPQALGPFAASDRNITNLHHTVTTAQLKQAAGDLAPGKATSFVGTEEGGFVFHLETRSPMPEEKMTKEFPAYLERMRSMNERRVFEDWANREMGAWLRSQPQSVQEAILDRQNM